MSKHEAEKHDDRHDYKEKHEHHAEKHHEKTASQHEAATTSGPEVTPLLLTLGQRQAVLDQAIKAITRGGPMIAQWKKLVVQVKQVRDEQV